jgi:hypothetical protein
MLPYRWLKFIELYKFSGRTPCTPLHFIYSTCCIPMSITVCDACGATAVWELDFSVVNSRGEIVELTGLMCTDCVSTWLRRHRVSITVIKVQPIEDDQDASEVEPS